MFNFRFTNLQRQPPHRVQCPVLQGIEEQKAVWIERFTPLSIDIESDCQDFSRYYGHLWTLHWDLEDKSPIKLGKKLSNVSNGSACGSWHAPSAQASDPSLVAWEPGGTGGPACHSQRPPPAHREDVGGVHQWGTPRPLDG